MAGAVVAVSAGLISLALARFVICRWIRRGFWQGVWQMVVSVLALFPAGGIVAVLVDKLGL